MRRLLVFLVLQISIRFLMAAPDTSYHFNAGIKLGYGFVIPHSPTIQFLANRHISQTEFFFEHQTYGNKTWHSRYSNPSIGVLFSRFDLKNSQHIGQVYSFSPYLKFKLAGGKKARLLFRPSIGLGYIQKPFHKEENFKNSAIGSHMNLFISLLLEGELQLHSRVGLTGGINLSHLSNTGFQTPNLGYNILTVSSGINYRFGQQNTIQVIDDEKLTTQKAYWQFSTGVGLNEINPPEGKKYLAHALFISREKKLTRKSSIGGGIDFFYNPAQRAFLKQDSTIIGKGFENVQIAASVSHILHFGRLSFTGQLSYYLKSANKELGNIYHVFGGRWAINKQFNVFFLGKTHIDKAEYVMIGVGLKLGHEK